MPDAGPSGRLGSSAGLQYLNEVLFHHLVNFGTRPEKGKDVDVQGQRCHPGEEVESSTDRKGRMRAIGGGMNMRKSSEWGVSPRNNL